jgi:hypothetical protein
MSTRIRFAILGSLALALATTGCSSSSDDASDPSTEGALERRAPAAPQGAVDLSKFSLVTGLVSVNRAEVDALMTGILSTSKKSDQSDRKNGDAVYAGMRLDGEDDPLGIACGPDGATRTNMCSLVTAIARASDVTGRPLDGAPGTLLPSKVKLTGKLADAVAEALPAAADGSRGVGALSCKKETKGFACNVPLNGFGVAQTLELSVAQTKEEEGQAKADKAKADFEMLVKMLFPEG